MFPPKKILFPVDFSDRCKAVAPMAEAFARRFHSQITLLHVTPARTPDDLNDHALEQLAEFAARVEFKGLSLHRLLLHGDAACEIVDFAHEQKSDLIMLPTHGYGPFRRFLLGSVTMKVLHDAGCPVWTDAHTEQLAAYCNAKFRSVVCAVDLSQKSHPTLRWAADFAKDADARLLIVHAIPMLAGAEFVYAAWQQEQIEAARKQIDCLQRSEGTHSSVDIVIGETAHAVRETAEKAVADLLVIGRSVDDTLIGRLRTHAYPIIRHSTCPVVSI